MHHDLAKKISVATHLLAAATAHVEHHRATIIGGDFNQGACNECTTVFPEILTPETPARAIWGPSALPEDDRDCTGIILMPRILDEGWAMNSVRTWDFDN